MTEIENIIDYSMPQMEHFLREGKKIYDFIEDHFRVYPVGVVPLSKDEGYLFLKEASCSDTRVYEYHISIFENPDERFRGIHVEYIATYERSLLNTYESIKSDLIRYNQKLPNPAAFVIEATISVPFDETFLPMAKRTLVKRLAANA